MAWPNYTLGPSGSGKDFTSMVTWESTAQGDYGSSPQDSWLDCDGADYGGHSGALDENVIINDWGTVAGGHLITIRPAAGSEHNGSRRDQGGTGFALIASSGHPMLPANDNVALVGIEIGARTNSRAIETAGATSDILTIDSCLVHQIVINSSLYAVDASGSTCQNLTIKNTVVDTEGYGLNIKSSNIGVIEFCSIYSKQGSGFGIHTNSNPNLTIRDSVIGANNVCIINPSNAADNYNITSDTSATGANSVHSVDLTTAGLNWTDPANGDLTPVIGGAIDSDTNPGIAIGGVTTDVKGTTRSDPPEIGAYEIQGAAPAVNFIGPDIEAQSGTKDTLFVFNKAPNDSDVSTRFTGASSYALDATSDTLPAGITVNATTGNLEGTPTEFGEYDIVIKGEV